MEAIDLVREHFNSLGTKRIEVPEWKLVIYSAPMTLAEKNRVYKKSVASDMDLLVDILIMKATDEAGKKLFTIEHRPTLLNKADSNVVARVANEMISSDSPKADELKN
jgi:hypothetical protein